MINETQKLDSTQAVVETQALNEDDIKNVKNDENVCQNGHDNISKENKLSRYSLKLLLSNNNNENGSLTNGHDNKFLFPLNVGLTTIGRSDSNDLCLIHKSISKKHACIELTLNEDTLELHKCYIWDDGSLNKTRLKNSEANLPKQEKHELKLDDSVQFGSVKFTFLKMTESEYEDQEKNRTKLIDLYTDTNLNGSIIKKQGKANGLFEIQNTLEETVLCENGDEEKQNGHKMYVADTDPEDNESFNEDNYLNNTSCPDFRLHMSASFVNQSVVSSRSILIPETMADEDLEETRDDGNPNNDAENKDTENKPDVEKENDSQVVTETVQVSDTVVEKVTEVSKEPEPVQETIPVVEEKETVEQEKEVVNEEKVDVSEEQAPEPVQEIVPVIEEEPVEEKIEKEVEQNKPEIEQAVEKVEEEEKVEENKPELMEVEKIVEQEKTEEKEPEKVVEENPVEESKTELVEEEKVVEESKVDENPVAVVEEKTKDKLPESEVTEEIKPEEEKKEETESKQETKVDFEIKKYNSLNDESIIINDDDEDDVSLSRIANKQEKNLIVNEKDSKSDDIIVESTLLDTSDVNIKSQPASQLSEAEPVEEKKEPVRKGRGRPPRNSTANQSIDQSHNESVKEDAEAETKPTRRSTRQSLPPAPKEAKKTTKRNSSVKNETKDEESLIEEKKDQEEKVEEKALAEDVQEKGEEKVIEEEKTGEKDTEEKPVEEKPVEEKIVEEKPVVEKAEAPRVTRRSSLRVKNTEAKPVVKQKRGVKVVEEDPKSEEEETEAKVAKQEEEKPKNRRKSVGVKKEEVREESKEDEESKRSLRNRRKTIEVSQVKVEEPKKKVTRRKSIKADNYQYDEEDVEEKKAPKRKSDEHEKAKNKKTRKDEATDDEGAKKTRKRKTSENKQQEELDDSFTRDFKQAQSESDSTPKIFFNSKRRKTPNSSINTTPMKNSTVETPTKKFKLHKSKSSSEENLQSSDEEIEKKQEEAQPEQEVEKPKVGRKVGRAASTRLTAPPARQSARSQRGSSALPHIMTSSGVNEKDMISITNKGGLVVDDVKECTHFVTGKIKKSFQFLACLAKGAFIVSEQWLAETTKGKMFANAQTYALSDTHGEKQFKFSLKTSMSKAKAHPLLSEWKFVIKFVESNEDEISLSELKTIIECAGGEVVDKLDENDLDKYCLIYKDMDLYEKDEENKSKECLKMTLDTLLDSILKQTFDINHDIEATD